MFPMSSASPASPTPAMSPTSRGFLRNPFIRSALRQVRDTLPRFLSILLITTLGVTFFAGLRMTGPYMKATADAWLDSLNFMDVQMFSTMGFDDEDIAAIRSTPGVTAVVAGYHANVLIKRGSSEISVQFLSLDPALTAGAISSASSAPLNKPDLLSGRLPQRPNECLAEERLISETDASLGSIVYVSSGTSEPLSDTLAFDEFIIVGIIKSPLFIGEHRGNSEIGAGHNFYFFFVPPAAFTLDVYTTVYLQVNYDASSSGNQGANSSGNQGANSGEENSEENSEGNSGKRGTLSRFSDAYFEAVAPTIKALEQTGETRSVIRYETIKLDAREKLDEAYKEVAEGYAALDAAKHELDEARLELENALAILEELRLTLDEVRVKLNASHTELNDGWADYNQQYTALQTAYANGLLSPGYYELAMQQLEVARQKLEAGESEYASGLAALIYGEDEYIQGLQDYNQGFSKYEDALAAFELERAEALLELAQAEKDIEKAEADLAKLKPPKWYVLDIDSNAGFRSYKQESEQLEAIAIVIPPLFFLIAALVSMTSMTRLVDKDRTIIGTYKALGYTNRAITLRYLTYAFAASLIASLIGIFVGWHLFPPLIFNAFRTMYTIPPGPILYSGFYAALSIGVALVSTVVPAALVSLRTLRETPAAAMRPLAPRPGKRIFLEYIKPLWRRLSFLHKVTARNLLRYKWRGVMTVFGVAGCTALIFTGFALNDSLATVGPTQYERIQRYDVEISFAPDASSEEMENLYAFLEQSPEFGSSILVRRENAEIVGPAFTKDITVIVPEEPESFSSYYAVQSRAADFSFAAAKPLDLNNGGIILTEQIARQIGVVLGSAVTIRTLDGKEASFEVIGISENYVLHYAFLTPAAYERGFGEKPEPNQILGLLDPKDGSLPESLLGLSAVTGVAYTQKTAESLADLTDVLGFVMVILILCAAAQIFVVLFSLNTINREERTRELASIKVLGFFNRELTAYIYREGFILTAIGIFCGLFLGIGLERYIIATIEIDIFMFSREILFTSYLFSILITAGFALIVNLLLYRPLTRIDMVSSLKAVE